MLTLPAGRDDVLFETSPARYRHWKLAVDGRVATLTLDVDETAGLRPGYALKLNSYDLGVDIELHDALERIRFEHPGVASVVITSGNERSFCAGANIYMLGTSSHRWKVNFCKFTNRGTRKKKPAWSRTQPSWGKPVNGVRTDAAVHRHHRRRRHGLGRCLRAAGLH